MASKKVAIKKAPRKVRPDLLKSAGCDLASSFDEHRIPQDKQAIEEMFVMSSDTETDKPRKKTGRQMYRQVYMSDQEYKEHLQRRDQEVRKMLVALKEASKVPS